MINAVISGTGSYLPEFSLSNYELETKLNTSHEWIFSRTGICSRHIAKDYETTSFMASKAAQKAIEASKLKPQEINLIVAATCTANNFFPSIACHIQHALQISHSIPAFDVSAACSGFVYALDIAKQYIASGAAKHVLVVGSESMSRAVDWQDRSTCVLFGDGAAAVVLSASDEPGIINSILHASYDEKALLLYPNYSTLQQKSYISMQGNEVFRIAVNVMGDVVQELLATCKLNAADLNWLIPHQANLRIIQVIAKKLKIAMSQVILTIETQGNTSAASIPLALDHAIRSKKIKRGDLLLLESFGGGLTWGAMLIRY